MNTSYTFMNREDNLFKTIYQPVPEKITVGYINHAPTMYTEHLGKSLVGMGLSKFDVIFTSDKDSPAKNYNSIIDQSKNRFILLVHQDVELPITFIETIHRTIKKCPTFGVLGIVGFDQLENLNRLTVISEPDKIRKVDFFDSCCIVINKENNLRFNETEFDELHMYVEDYCMQAIEHGLPNHTLQLPYTECKHFGHTYGQNGDMLWGRYEEYYIKFINKWIAKLHRQLFYDRAPEQGGPIYFSSYEEYLNIKKPVEDRSVTVEISTKDRYFTTLPLTIEAIANQTLKPKHLILLDDGEQRDLWEIPLYQNLFALLDRNNIGWNVVFGERKGQVSNHQKAIELAQTPFIWRLDDDNIPEPNVLEHLMLHMTNGVGAVAGAVLDPKTVITDNMAASNAIEDIYKGLNMQWFHIAQITEVDHLYSTFVFRKEAAKHGYCKNLSPAGHREETIFTHEMKRTGWKLLVIPNTITWHARNPEGGIRSFTQMEFWEHDEGVFSHYMKSWGVVSRLRKLIVLDNGIGDHFAFKMILPEIQRRYDGHELILAVCYPDVFKDVPNISLISIADAQTILNGNLDTYNIYKFMTDRKWHTSMLDAYREMYL